MARSLSPSVPRYRSLYETLRQSIVSETLPVGTKLPTEEELCRIHKISRHTVRAALRDLREDGLIASRQGAGSVVARQSPHMPYTTTISSLEELLHYASEAHYHVARSGMVVADAVLAQRLGGQPGQRWLRVEGLRHTEAQSAPVCWTEVFVHADYAGIGLGIGRRRGTIYSWIEEMYGVQIAEVRQVLAIEPMPAAVAEELGCPPDSLAVGISRSYHLPDGARVEVAFNLHPAERFRYELTLRKRDTPR